MAFFVNKGGAEPYQVKSAIAHRAAGLECDAQDKHCDAIADKEPILSAKLVKDAALNRNRLSHVCVYIHMYVCNTKPRRRQRSRTQKLTGRVNKEIISNARVAEALTMWRRRRTMRKPRAHDSADIFFFNTKSNR